MIGFEAPSSPENAFPEEEDVAEWSLLSWRYSLFGAEKDEGASPAPKRGIWLESQWHPLAIVLVANDLSPGHAHRLSASLEQVCAGGGSPERV